MKVNFKPGQLLPTFDYTITILNKLKAQHSETKQDIWKKTVVKNCAWSSNLVRNIAGTSVSVGASYIVRIPKNEDYKPYSEWIKTMQGFTFSTGDYLILGDIEEEIITPQTVLSIIRKYRPNACEIRFFKDNTGTVEVAEHYHLEGV